MVPRPVKDFRSFLGLVEYYRSFMYSFAITAKPLTMLLYKGQAWMWEEEQQEPVEQLKLHLESTHLGKTRF